MHAAKRSPLVHQYHVYTIDEIVHTTFAYLICGLRPTPGATPANDWESPLQRWLLSPVTARCPLVSYVAILTERFMKDLLRQWWCERKKVQAYHQHIGQRPNKRHTIAATAESATRTRALCDVSSSVEASVVSSRLAHGWIHQLTEDEQEILRLTTPAFEGLSQTEAAQRLGISDATLSRCLRRLRMKFQDYLEGA
jgi:RNA polymerase sigma factor (sigma-70 family)